MALVPHLYAQLPVSGRDAEAAVSKLSGEVEWFSHRLLERKPTRVFLHGRFDGLAHLRSCAEVSVCWHEAADALMRPVEVVALDEEAQPSHAVVEVCEDSPPEKLVPERLPESLRLPQGLRVVRPAPQVSDVVAPQLGLKLSAATPRRVLSAVVRQRFGRRAKR